MEGTLNIISGIPIFSGLPEGQLKEIQKIAINRRFKKGEAIFSEGDDGDGFFVVADGLVKIFKLSTVGKEQILHIFGPGEPFGEVPVFSGQRFPANAQAIIESRLLFFPRGAFIDLISGNPSLALNMLAVLSKRLRQFTVQIENLSLKEVPARLAAYLLYLSELNKGKRNLELDISKGQLASLLGTIPETLSRILGRMNKKKLIESDGPRIRILDVQRLQDLAEAGVRL